MRGELDDEFTADPKNDLAVRWLRSLSDDRLHAEMRDAIATLLGAQGAYERIRAETERRAAMKPNADTSTSV